MLKWFKAELKKEEQNIAPWFKTYGYKSQHLYVIRFFKLRQSAVVFWLSNGIIQINFNNFCALIWDKQSPRSLLGMLGLNLETTKDAQVIAIFSE